ncbi:hypothetical protein GBAR_LOCUS6933 [Geodia barretti]|uniref:Uncharacterized protein n=1 Tax=Geodia barretti TaxID=519541 RepID=A0AA35WDF7_GEOBA|nr:hypothetical protein GBAR_LOCUS6933 [Geodia barretti]
MPCDAFLGCSVSIKLCAEFPQTRDAGKITRHPTSDSGSSRWLKSVPFAGLLRDDCDRDSTGRRTNISQQHLHSGLRRHPATQPVAAAPPITTPTALVWSYSSPRKLRYCHRELFSFFLILFASFED